MHSFEIRSPFPELPSMLSADVGMPGRVQISQTSTPNRTTRSYQHQARSCAIVVQPKQEKETLESRARHGASRCSLWPHILDSPYRSSGILPSRPSAEAFCAPSLDWTEPGASRSPDELREKPPERRANAELTNLSQLIIPLSSTGSAHCIVY